MFPPAMPAVASADAFRNFLRFLSIYIYVLLQIFPVPIFLSAIHSIAVSRRLFLVSSVFFAPVIHSTYSFLFVLLKPSKVFNALFVTRLLNEIFGHIW